jgi:isocitrate dehydrogenase
MSTAKIIYTKTDEAPALATYSFLPVVNAFTEAAGFDVETRDMSLAARILANFPDKLNAEQKVSDERDAAARQARQGYDLRNGQCPARLPH